MLTDASVILYKVPNKHKEWASLLVFSPFHLHPFNSVSNLCCPCAKAMATRFLQPLDLQLCGRSICWTLIIHTSMKVCLCAHSISGKHIANLTTPLYQKFCAVPKISKNHFCTSKTVDSRAVFPTVSRICFRAQNTFIELRRSLPVKYRLLDKLQTFGTKYRPKMYP